MIEMIDIKAACNGLLRTRYPTMKIYGPDTTGALERPSFYTEIVPYRIVYETINRVKQSAGFKISIMEKVTNEEFELRCLAEIRQMFGLRLSIKGRNVVITGVDTDYTGSKNDVFQITVTMEWYDSITETKSIPLVSDVSVGTALKGE